MASLTKLGRHPGKPSFFCSVFSTEGREHTWPTAHPNPVGRLDSGQGHTLAWSCQALLLPLHRIGTQHQSRQPLHHSETPPPPVRPLFLQRETILVGSIDSSQKKKATAPHLALGKSASTLPQTGNTNIISLSLPHRAACKVYGKSVLEKHHVMC